MTPLSGSDSATAEQDTNTAGEAGADKQTNNSRRNTAATKSSDSTTETNTTRKATADTETNNSQRKNSFCGSDSDSIAETTKARKNAADDTPALHRIRLHRKILEERRTSQGNNPTTVLHSSSNTQRVGVRLMRLDNAPNPHCYKDGEHIPPSEPRLPQDDALEAGKKYATKMQKHVRISSQCADIPTLLACKFIHGAMRYEQKGRHKEYPAIWYYQQETNSLLLDQRNQTITLFKAAELVIRYYHPIAEVVITMQSYSPIEKILKKANVRLRTLKKKMMAKIILNMSRGFGRNRERYAATNKLSAFRTSDPNFFYLYILPLVHTAVFMMDKEEDLNLTIDGILNTNLDCFTRHNVRNLRKLGCWSLNFLNAQQDDLISDELNGALGSGFEITCARIFCMLTPSAGLPEITKCFVTDEEREILLDETKSLYINEYVFDRVRHERLEPVETDEIVDA
ncbi:MAG: hypothetical protein ACRCZI_04010 [Cetobacterium sp.]